MLFLCRLQNCYYKRVFEQSSIRIIETSINRIIKIPSNRSIDQSNHRSIELSRFRTIELSRFRAIESSRFRVIESSNHRNIEIPGIRRPLRHARPDTAAPAAGVCAASRAPSVRCRRPQCLVRPSARAGVRAQPHGHWRASGVPAPDSADTKKRRPPAGTCPAGGAVS